MARLEKLIVQRERLDSQIRAQEIKNQDTPWLNRWINKITTALHREVHAPEHVCDFRRTDRLLKFSNFDGAVDVFTCSCGRSVATMQGEGPERGIERQPDPRGFPYDCLFNYDPVQYAFDNRAASITFNQPALTASTKGI